MRSLRARVAVTAIVATAAAFVLSGVVVVGTFAFEARFPERMTDAPPGVTEPSGRPPWMTGEHTWEEGGPPPFLRALALRLVGAGAIVLLLVGAVGLRLGGVALAPLVGLRAAAERVASTRDLETRLPQQGPEEVRALAGSLNAMLARLQASTAKTEATLAASRRFTADAGHELRTPLTSMRTNLDVLRRSPSLPAQEREILDDVAGQQHRLVSLLDGLQQLARGDTAHAVPREEFDLVDVVDAAATAARARHPSWEIVLHAPAQVMMTGWAEGMRLVVRNLIDNAVVHGHPTGRVEVTLATADDQVRVVVDDDGPGIPVDERRRVLEWFHRGEGTIAPGHGLGLALVTQQAALHRGHVTIGAAPSGGARVTAVLSRSGGHPGGGADGDPSGTAA